MRFDLLTPGDAGLKDRRLLRPGFGADLIVFDPATVADRASWDESRQEPAGIECVIVDGRTVVEWGRPIGRLPGRVLR